MIAEDSPPRRRSHRRPRLHSAPSGVAWRSAGDAPGRGEAVSTRAQDGAVARVLQHHPHMAELIHTHSAQVRGPEGASYEARIYAEPERGGTWKGWVEFHHVSGDAASAAPRVLRTDRETTQPNRQAVDYWAGGLEPIYLEGALKRAQRAD